MTAARTQYRLLAAILFAVLTMQAPATVKTRPAPAPPLSQSAGVNLSRDYGKLPLAFEPNVGQTDAQVRFLARGGGMTTFFTDTETVMVLSRSRQAKKPEGPGWPEAARGEVEQAVVRMKLAGASRPRQATGIEKLPGISNYFIGNDPTKWRTDVPHYGRIQYEGVYPGIDLVWYGNQRRLEYDFIMAPGADPNQIQVAYEGVESLAVEAGGDLVLRTALGEMRQLKARVYQDVSGKQVEVAARYAIVAGNRVRFDLARYDRKRPLRIDPVVLVYSTYLGGGDDDEGHGIAVDRSGSAYVTGYTLSSNFPTQSAYQPTRHGDYDVFVTKLTPAGNAPVYSTYLGGSGADQGYGIAVDGVGYAYVTGQTRSTNFPTQSAYQATYQGGSYDAFVTKLTPAGNALAYSTYLGGSGDDYGRGIAVDGAGSAYVTGNTSSTNFPTRSAYQATYQGGNYDAFVTKLTPAGNALVYSTHLGGSGDDYGRGIAVDGVGYAYVTGQTGSTNFPTQSAYQATYQGAHNHDAFVTKLTPAGNALVYSTYLGGSGDDIGYGIAVDGAGSAYVTGQTWSTNFPTQSAYQATFQGLNSDVFVTKLMPAGNALVYSTYLGGSVSNGGTAIAVDGAGSAYVTGLTWSTDFPTQSAYQATNQGYWDAFVTKLTPAGNALVYSTYLGGSGSDQGYGIAVDGAGSAYVTGHTSSTNFPIQSSYQATFQGGSVFYDAFVTKLVTPVTPSALAFNSAVGGSSQTQYISLLTGTVSSFGYSPAALGTWLVASLYSGTQVAVTVNPTSLAAGTYTGAVTVNGIVVNVTLTVAGAHAATINTTLTVTNATGSIGTAITFTGPATLTNIGNGTFVGTLNLTSTAPGSFTITLTTGDRITGAFTVPASALAGGPLSGSLTVTGGTGAYTGATGSFPSLTGTTSIGVTGFTMSFSGSGTISTGPGTISPALSVSPSSVAFAYQVGAFPPAGQSFTVGGPAGIAFTASPSGGSWLSVSPVSGTTPASVTVSVNPAGLNTGTYSGSVVISASGASNSPQSVFVTLTVTGIPCTYALGTTSASFPASGGTGSVSVSASPGCQWGASPTVSWIHINSGTPGSGSGTVTYAVDANTNTSSRSGTIGIAGKSLTISQTGLACSFAVNTRSVAVPSAGVAGNTLAVTANAPDCAWTASANAPWLFVNGGARGTGSATVTFTVGVNPGTSRTGTMTVASHTVYINQLGQGDAASSGAGIPDGAVVNAASGSTPIAPGAFVTIYGQNLADSSATWDSAIVNGQLPTSLAGVSVSINGKSAFPSMVGPNQINVLAPADIAPGPVDVDVATPHGVAAATVNMAPVVPALFTYTLSGKAYAAALFASDYTYVAAAGAIPGLTSRAAMPGDYVLLFTSVLGPTNPPYTVGRVLDPIQYPIVDLSQVRVLIGGQPVPVFFAGLTFPGMFQVNIQIPASIPAGDQPVVILVGGQSSQAGVALTIGN
jgi:uncharacterized protein (TIGR03437 family)